jgi:uncharacterized membrane protein
MNLRSALQSAGWLVVMGLAVWIIVGWITESEGPAGFVFYSFVVWAISAFVLERRRAKGICATGRLSGIASPPAVVSISS